MKNRSPRELFLTSKPRVERHLQLVDDPGFVATTNDVLAQLALTLPSTKSPAEAWNNANIIEGARLYRELLLTFADQNPKSVKPVSDSLEPT